MLAPGYHFYAEAAGDSSRQQTRTSSLQPGCDPGRVSTASAFLLTTAAVEFRSCRQ